MLCNRHLFPLFFLISTEQFALGPLELTRMRLPISSLSAVGGVFGTIRFDVFDRNAMYFSVARHKASDVAGTKEEKQPRTHGISRQEPSKITAELLGWSGPRCHRLFACRTTRYSHTRVRRLPEVRPRPTPVPAVLRSGVPALRASRGGLSVGRRR